MTRLSKQEFLAPQIDVEEVEIDGVGSVLVRSMPYAQFIEFSRSLREIDDEDEQKQSDLILSFAVRSLCNESGEPWFEPGEIDDAVAALNKKWPVRAVNQLREKCMRLNGLATDEALKAEVGN